MADSTYCRFDTAAALTAAAIAPRTTADLLAVPLAFLIDAVRTRTAWPLLWRVQGAAGVLARLQRRRRDATSLIENQTNGKEG